jgi:hypothetical protein
VSGGDADGAARPLATYAAAPYNRGGSLGTSKLRRFAMADETTRPCQQCGASIYTEHLDTGIAGYHAGKLLCPHCLEEAEAKADLSSGGGADGTGDLETIALIDEEEPGAPGKGESQIRSLGSETQVGGAAFDEGGLKRQVRPDTAVATRCRTFHSKLNEGAVAFMNRQINEWTDENPDVSIKFATSTIGVFEGKKADPHIILTVFY